MQICKVCGGTVRYVNNQLVKCEYCGKLYCLNGDTLIEANFEDAYNEAVSLSKSEKENEQLVAISIWEALGSYKDSAIRIQECREIISKAKIAAEDKRLADLRRAELDEIERKKRENIEKQKKKIIYMAVAIAGVVVVLGGAITTISSSVKKSKYEEAVALYESKQYDEALILFEELNNYSDASEYATNAKNTITEQENAYKKGIGYFETGQYANAIEELTFIAEYLDAGEYIQKSATNLYEQAVTAYEEGNYSEAKEKLALIPEDCNEYIQGNSMLAEIDKIIEEQQKLDNYNQAVVAYETGEYDAAQRLFVGLGDYEETEMYLTEIGTIIFAQAEEAYKNGDYDLCGKCLEKVDDSEEWSMYSTAVEYKNSVKEKYCTLIIEEGTRICRTEGETPMNTYIEEMRCSLLSSQDIEELKSHCTVETVSLEEIEPYYKAGKDHIREENGFEDISGNVYAYALISKTDDYGFEREWIYDIGGNYTVFAADIVVEKNPGSHATGDVRIYGDNKLLFSHENIESKTKSYPIEVDVTGVTDLKIMIFGNQSSWTGYGLGNPRLIE